jgi:hypothetical protein
LDVLSSGTQLRLTYTDGSVYSDFAVDSSGNLTITPSGSKISLAYGKGLVLGSNSSEGAGVNGMMYYNTTLNKFRCYQGGAWTDCKGIDAPVDASYLVLNLNDTLTNERVLSAGAGLESIDSGANNFFTLRIKMAGISTCTNPTTNKIIWDSTYNQLTCATDQTGGGGGLPAGSSGDTLRYDGTNWVANNVIYNNGTNVGIGVGSSIDSNYKLTIGYTGVKITNTGSTYTLYAEDEASDATPFVIDASGNVGIGTNTPDTNYKLDVNGKIATPYKKDFSTWPGNSTKWKADINKDGIVYFDDATLIKDNYGQPADATIVGVDNLANYITRADLDIDGNGTIGLGDLTAIAANLTRLVTPQYVINAKSGDINRDGRTDYKDFMLLATAYGYNSASPEWNNKQIGTDVLGYALYVKDADLNGDGKVDLSDLVIVSNNFEETYYLRISGKSGLPAALFLNGNVGIDNDNPQYYLDVGSGGASTARFGTASTDKVVIGGGAGKLDVGTIDPIFDIDGKKYATYMTDFAGGTRVETSGVLKLENTSINQHQSAFMIDFDELKEDSDLWLFWQVSNKNINDLTVLLTPGFEGKVWYEKNGNKIIIYGDRAGEVSYKFLAPRFDYQKWGNLTEDQNLTGIKISE